MKPFCFLGMKSRNEIGKNIFDLDDENLDSVDEGWNQQSLAALEDNSVLVRHREREIQKIVQSIAELNTIFKDLATMVSEQVLLSLI
jgi:syntaxin 16